MATAITQVNAQWFQVRNTSGSGSPNPVPSTIYLGDTGLTFGCDAWGTLGGEWGGITIYIHTGTDIHNGTAGGAISYLISDAKSNTSGKFTSTGTWYWGARIQYNTGAGVVGWYCRNRSYWSDAWGTPTSDLSLTVNALNDPSSQVANRNTTNPSTEVDLTWTRGTSGTAKDTIILRKTSAITVDPTQGTSYGTGSGPDGSTIIYKSSGTSYTDTSLSGETKYYYKFYSVNNDYYSPGVTANHTTLATEPVSSPNTLSFSSVADTSMTINWANVSTQVLVVVRAASDLSHDPGDTTNYTANAALGSGSSLGGGSVVYIGNGTSVGITGLTADSLYYTRIYNFKGAGGTSENYRTSDELNGSQYTLDTEPSGHVGSFAASAASQTQVDLSWTAAAGPPTGYIIMMKTNSTPTGVPVDGTGYTVGDHLGDSTVAAIVTPGSSTSKNLTDGIEADQHYYFKIYPYNGSQSQSYNYRTAATVPSADDSTPVNVPGTPSNMTASDGSSEAHVALSWGNVLAETGYDIYRNTVSNSGTATVIYTNIYDVVTHNDTTATPGQQYYYWVTATNSGGASPFSNGDGGYRKLAEVTSVAATDDTFGDKVQITWDNMTGETGYGIWRHTSDASASATYLDSTAADTVTYDDTSATAGQQYYYWVRSTNNTTDSQSDFQVSGEPGSRADTTAAPSVDTPTASSITYQGATLGGNISTNGGEAITYRGTVWDTSATPTANEATEGGTATGVFSHARSGMAAGTLIYYRAWASNSVGKGFSADGSFWTVPHAPTPAASSSIAGKSFSANWAAATGATNYWIDVSTASDFSSYVSGFENKLLGIVTTISVTGLSENTTYYLRLRSQNSGGTSTSSVSQTTLTVPLAPVASAATSATVSSFDANWAAATGATSYRLDVSTVANFASYVTGWEDVNTGNVVTYAVNSGLSAGSKYYYRVRSVNASGASTNSGVITAYTLSTEPTGHAGSFAAAAASDTQIDLSWTAAAGPPSGYIIIQRTGADPTGTPSDGTAYSVSDAIGDGTVAAIVTPGSSTSKSITGLSAGTAYHFSIIPFNWDGANTETYNYRTAATIPTANDTTWAAEPTQATTITFSSIDKDTITVSWTTGDGSSALVLAHEGAAVDSNPTDANGYTANANFGDGQEIGTGNFVVYSGAGTSVAVTGLKTNTTYHFRVYEFNGSSATANYNVNTASGNPASQATLDNEPGMKATPAAFNHTIMVGESIAAEGFGVTNIGGSSLSYSVASNVNWLSISPVSGSSLAAGAGQDHTITYVTTGLEAGTSNATITLTSTGSGQDAATNSPITVTVALTITNIPNPSAATVSVSGQEYIKLEWTKATDHDVMIVHKAGSASTAPSGGTAYSVGDSVGGGTVIYKGAGSKLEHIVSAGVTHHYAFYSVANNHYSPGLTDSGTTATYAAPVVENFAYTNGTPVIGLGGGTGWSGNWAASLGTGMGISTQQFTSITGYDTYGNSMTGNNCGVYRNFTTAVTTGQLYVAFMMRTDNGGGTQYSGLSFFDNGTEERFYGEGYSQVNELTVGGTAGHNLANDTDYTIVALYDFENDVARALLYTNATQSIPVSEPGTWHVSEADATVTSINRIRIESNVGIRWDDVRIGYRWSDLFVEVPTYEWDAGGGSGDRSWSTTANWTADTEPVASSNAFVNGGYTGVVSAAGEVAADLFVGNNETGRLEQTGGDLSLTNFYLGDDTEGRGVYIMSGGDLDVAVTMGVGHSGIATAMIYGADSDIVIGSDLQIGFSNANNRAAFIHNDGTVTVNRIYLGKNSGTEGLYTITNGVLHVTDDIYLADGHVNSTGRMVIAGAAAVNVDDEFYAGRNGEGVLAVRDNAVLTLASGTGHLIVSDLTDNNNANLVQLDGGTINVGGNIIMADAADSYGSLTVSNGLISAGDDIIIANNADATGVVTVVGGNVDPNDDVYVGFTGDGSFTISGGTVTADQFYVANSAGSVGAATMSGGFIDVNGTAFDVGVAGVGTFTLSGGTINVGDGTGNTDFTLGSAAGGKGTFTHTGGTVLFNDPASSDDTDLVIGGTASTGLYILAGSGNLNVGGGDDILINAHGELRLVGSGWTATADDDFTMAADSALSVVFSNGMERVVVDTDVTIAGTLNITNVGSLSMGTYPIVTSVTRSVTGQFDATNWLGGVTGTVTYADGLVAIVFSKEIAVSGNDVDIADGDSTPTTADHTGFGEALVAGGTVDRTYTITNSGYTAMTAIGNVSVGGTDAGDFSVTAQPASRLEGVGGAAITFTVQFNPTATGQRNATLSFSNDDADENPFNFSIQGYGTEPEIAVSGNGTDIADGDSSPSLTDHTDFGSALVAGGTVQRTYTVTNIGAASLTLGTVSIGGTHSADFTVNTDTTTPLASSNSLTFVIEFNPSATGQRDATISFTTDDSDENPFNFSIQGTGIEPEIAVSGNGNDIADGDSSPTTTDDTDFGYILVAGGTASHTFTVTNIGTSTLNLGNITTSGTHQADFIITTQPGSSVASSNSTTFIVQFNPSGTGQRTAAISFTTDDADENPFNFSLQGYGTEPEIAVSGNGADITDGDASPATADDTDFGNVTIAGGTASHTFTVTNVGSSTLTLGTITTGGTHAADFTITTQPGSSVTSSNSTTFVVEFDPSATGLREATISFTTDDGNENPFNFSIQGTGIESEIAVSGNGADITDGDSSPATADDTDFGSVLLAGGTASHTFTVTNTGTGPLTLGNVTTSGTHAADFIITTQPTSPLASSNSTTFVVQFNPSGTGVRSAAISFVNGDGDENPFNFSIQGTGVEPEIAVSGNGADITDGDSSPAIADDTDFSYVLVSGGTASHTFTVTNVGTSTLTLGNVTTSGTHAADFIITTQPGSSVASSNSTTFVVQFNPSGTGQRTAAISFTTDDADENPFNFSLQGYGTEPEIAVSGNGADITDGDASPATADDTDFSEVAVSGGTASHTFTVTNIGSASLTLGNITTGGTHAADFTITTQPTSPVASSNSTTFVIEFDPSATGLREATISFTTGDGDENPFNFSLQGTGIEPEIAVSGNGADITDGDASPATADDTDFGSVLVAGGTASHTFTVTNIGTGSLTLGNVTTSGTHAADFIITTQPTSPLVSSNSTTFVVQFNPSGTGVRSAAISFVTGDGDENPFNFSLQGTGIEPEIAVSGNGADIADGDSSPTTTDDTDFGYILVAGGTASHTFTVTNIGTSTLNLGNITTSGTHQADFIITTQPGSSVASSNSTTFIVQFNPSGTGQRTAAISFTTDDADENPFNFSLQGYGTEPEIAVSGNGADVTDGDASPATADDTDFSFVLVSGGTASHTFTVTNVGSSTLTLGNVTTSGTHEADFIITTQPGSSVTSSNSTTFVVQFNPSGTGQRTAAISFTTDDGDENPFNFSLQGYGTEPEIAVSGNGADITDGDSSPAVADDTDFGDVAVSGGTGSHTFTVTNVGSSTLTLGNVTTSGTHQADFIITTQPGSSVTTSNSTTFVVQFNPSGSGVRTAAISFTTDDGDENPFNFSLQGTGTQPGISNNPTSFAMSSTLGDTPSAVSFGVTNIGTGTLDYDISTNAGWLTVSPVSGSSIASGAGQQHTVTFATLAGFEPGTSNATITVTGGTASNSPKTVSVAWTINAINDPSAATAEADGPELVRLNWTKHASYDVMIVHKAGSASTGPTQGTAYNVGDSVGGGTVIYKGAGSYLDHIVSAGTAHHYAFYSYNGNYYSSGLTDNDTTGSYDPGIIENFAYTNNISINGKGTGQDWTNNWNVTAGSYGVSTSKFSAITGYPSDAANVATGTSSTAFRNFTGITTGKVYVSYKFRVSAGTGFAGLSFVQDQAEQIFLGESGAGTSEFVIDGGGGNLAVGGQLANDQDYTLIGCYDFDANTAKGLIYTNATQTIPAAEPGTWHAEVSDGDPSRIDGIRLSSGSGTIVTRWDEIRVAQSWVDLLQIVTTEPSVTNLVVNDGSNVTDEQVADGLIKFVADLYDTAGIETVSTTSPYFKPNFDIFNTVGQQILTDEVFEGFAYVNGGTTVIATDFVHAVTGVDDITLGTYTTRISIANSNGFTVANVVTQLNGTALTFTVEDDDTVVPVVNFITSTNNGSNRRLHLSLADSAISGSGSNTNILYSMTDDDLANVGTTGPLIFWFGAGDAGSGLARSTANPETNTSFTIGSAIISNVANYDASRSSAESETTNDRSTNVWTWTTAFSDVQIDNLVTNTFHGYGTNKVMATIRDGDLDRGATDQLSLHDQQVGLLVVTDDDTTAPVHSGFNGLGRPLDGATFTNSTEFASDGLIITGLVNDAGSGVYGGTSNEYVLTRNGSQVDSGNYTAGFSDGGNGALSNTIAKAIIEVVGTYTVTVFSADYDIDRPGDSIGYLTNFVFTVVDPAQAPGIDASPENVYVHVMMGDTASNVSFTVENVGTGDLIYTNYQTYGSGASGWLTVTPNVYTSGTFASRVHTGSVDVSSITDAGTYIATNRVDGNQTNDFTNVVFNLVVTNIPDASAASAVADGQELIHLDWTKHANHDVMIVHNAGSAPGAPAQNMGYALGASIPGGGTVIYKGSGSYLQHVVSQGTQHYYEFYSIHNTDYYSAGVSDDATTLSYSTGELVDDFAYTNDVTMNGLGNAQGWTNDWAVSAPHVAADVVIDTNNFTTFQADWPSEYGNRLVLKTTNSSEYTATRNFDGITTGSVYVAGLYRREFGEGADGKYSGLRFLSGATQQGFVGERGTTVNDDVFGVSVATTGNVYGAANSFPEATDYLIIGRYDFDTDIMAGIYYTSGQSVPSVEPTFFITATNSSVTRIDGVSLVAGASSGWNGQVFFDEIRVAQSWEDLLKLTGGPYVTNYLVDAANQVTDGQVGSGEYSVQMYMDAGEGIETVSTTPPYFKPNFDILNPLGTEILTDQVFSSFAYLANGGILASNTSHSGADSSAIVLGSYTSRWSAIASNGLSSINVATLSNNTAITFTVVDDDTTAPTPVNMTSPESGASRSMHVTSNSTAVAGSGSGTNIAYTLRDEDLTTMSGGTPLIFYFGAVDSGSGLARSNGTTAVSNSYLNIGQAVVSNTFNWDNTRSSGTAETDDAVATNVWSWVGAMTSAEIDNLVTNTIHGYGTNAVTVTWRDGDADRVNDDWTTLTNYQHGLLVVEDDDTAGPEMQNFNLYGGGGNYTATVAELQSGSGWSITGRVRDTKSGVNVGSGTTQPDIEPYFVLLDPSGNVKLTEVFGTLGFADGGATTLSSIGDSTHGTIATVPTGTWTARVVVADNDEDRTYDRSITTNEFAFEVVVGPSQAGMLVDIATLAVTSTYGTVAGDVNWPNFTVTNNGIGSLNYDATISYSGGSGWLTVDPASSISIGTGITTQHTASVDASGLNPGTYQATVTLDGNQTNDAQTVTVDLTVEGYYVNEIVDQFTNSVGGGVNGKSGGHGWTNNWSAGAFSYNSGSLSVPTEYPASSGNKICGDSTTEITATRNFPAFTEGKIFVATAITKNDGANGGYIGATFMDGTASLGFFGKIYNSEWLGLDGTNSSTIGNFGIYGSATYLIIGYYDFDTDIFRTRAWNPGDTLPLTEPTSWNASNHYTMTRIDGVRLGSKEAGNVCFDELRVASSWVGLLNEFNVEPTDHPTTMTFADVTTNSMTVTWVNGNGAARIVVAHEGSTTTFSPDDASNYTANADFSLAADAGGGNKVIYNGSGNSVDVTGLSDNTNYYYTVFEYNGGGLSADYLTNGVPLTGSRWTLKVEPTAAVTDLAAFTVSGTEITNQWTAVTADGYVIFRQVSIAPSNVPADGVAYVNGQSIGDATTAWIVTNGTDEAFRHEDLDPCDTYHFVIYPYAVNSQSDETINYYTNTPATASVATDCEAPTLQASNIVFSAIGTNKLTVTWDNGNGDGRIVVIRGTNAVSQLPNDGTSYTADSSFKSGSSLGDGNYVVYADTNNVVTVDLLSPGDTYHFRVFEYNGSGISIGYNTNIVTGNPNSTELASFDIVYEKFGYGNFENLSGKSGGVGWTNNWSTGGGLVESSNGNFPRFGAYPDDSGTVSGFMDMNNGVGGRTLSRNFPGRTSGRIYISMKIFNGHYLDTADYFGIDLLSGNTTTGFFGKASGVTDRKLSLAYNGATRTNRVDGENAGYEINNTTDYLLVGMYDFDTKTMRVTAYTTNNIADANPEQELGWQVEMTNVCIDRIDGIKVVASDNDQSISFDHIRIGPSWEKVVWDLEEGHHEDNGPTAELIFIGTNYSSQFYSQVITNLSDAELRSAENIDFAVRWSDSDGIFLTNNVSSMAVTNIGSREGRVNPNWDPLAVGVDSNRFNLDKFFTNFFGVSGDTVITAYHKAAFNVTNIDFDINYFVTVSAEDQPGGTTIWAPNGAEDVPVTRAITVNQPLQFYIYDDDTNQPIVGAEGLMVMTNTSSASFQSTASGPRYFVTDGSLADNGMDVSLAAYDEYSGLQRSSDDDSSTNMSLTIDSFVTSNTTRYVSTRSMTDSTDTGATNLWNFAASNFTYDAVSTLWGGDGTTAQGQDLEVSSTIPDGDEDRLRDQLFLSNEVYGIIRVIDDDENAPGTTNISYGTGTVNNRPFYVATNEYSAGSSELIRGTYSRRSGVGADTVFALTDAELNLSGEADLEFVFGVQDIGTGIGRGTTGTTNTVMSFSLGDVVSGIFTQYNAALSSGTGDDQLTTNIYKFADGFFTESYITGLMALTDADTSAAVRVTVPDLDNDRTNDQSTLYSESVGHLKIYDDDANGPTMGDVTVAEATGGGNIVITSFETTEGWPSSPISSAIATNVTDNFGTWYMEGVTHTSLDPKNTGTRRLGFRTNDFALPWLQLPPMTNPGSLFLYAARVSGGSGVPSLQVEVSNKTTHVWDSLGSQEVDTTTYQQYSWDVDLDDTNVMIRVRRVDASGVDRSQIYLDDLSLTERASWISTNEVRINWVAATDDYSGVDEYRLVPPAGGAAPTATNDGNYASSATTTSVESIQGYQGVITGYIFSIDNDNDRSQDRAMGNVAPVIVRVDTNPPIALPSIRASDANLGYLFDDGIDESDQIKVEWAPGAATEKEASGWRQSDSAELSPWDTYEVKYYEVADENNVPIGGAVTTVITKASSGWGNTLNTHTFTNLVLSNLTFDAYYSIWVRGEDEAGNKGPWTNVVGNTDRFVVTQGVNRLDLDLQVFWKGIEGRDYDVLYSDSALGFYTGMSNLWTFMQYTNSPVMFDVGYTTNEPSRLRPGELTNTTYRFYRVAKTGRWQTNNAPRVGSVETYVTKSLDLYPGENWHSTFFLPDTATVAYVFNTNLLPAADNFAEATKISWFSPTSGGTTNQNGMATAVVWLANSGEWTWQVGGTGNADNKLVPPNEGFLLELPSTASRQSLILIGLLPTQEVSHVISGGSTATNNIHLLSYNLPVRTYLKNIGIKGSGFTGSNNGSLADEVRILAAGGQGSLENPKARIRLRTDQTTWQYYYPPGGGIAVDPQYFVIEPDDTVVIVRRTSGTMTWTNAVPFIPPTKNFTP